VDYKNNFIIVAGDLDFGELWYWHYSGKLGVIILRMDSYIFESQFKIIKFLHDKNLLRDDKLSRSLVVSAGSKYRFRTV